MITVSLVLGFEISRLKGLTDLILIGEHLDCFLFLLIYTGKQNWQSVHSLDCFWPLTASIIMEVKNNYAHVTIQRIH